MIHVPMPYLHFLKSTYLTLVIPTTI